MGCFSLFLILFAAVFGLSSVAQSPEPLAVQDFQRYDDIPQSRTEDGAFVLGYEDAPVTIVIFEDFFCPHCQSLHPTIDQIVETYVRTGAAKYEWRAMATAGGERLNEVARLLECAEDQQTGAFWEGYLLTYDLTTQREFPNNAAALYANKLKLDEDELLTCSDTAFQYLVDAELADDLGVMGTPGIYIRYGDSEPTLYQGGRSFDDFARMIEEGKYGKPDKENET